MRGSRKRAGKDLVKRSGGEGGRAEVGVGEDTRTCATLFKAQRMVATRTEL